MYTDLMAVIVARILLLPLALMVGFVTAVCIFKDTSVPIPAAIEVMLLFLSLLFLQHFA